MINQSLDSLPVKVQFLQHFLILLINASVAEFLTILNYGLANPVISLYFLEKSYCLHLSLPYFKGSLMNQSQALNFPFKFLHSFTP